MKIPKWNYNSTIVESVDDIKTTNPDNLVGFVYEITFSDGKKYIGKKNLFHNLKKKKTLKSLQQFSG